jgi:hypothetical protein
MWHRPAFSRFSLSDLFVPTHTRTHPNRKIHVLGAFQNIKIARDMIVRLILGSPPGKVYNMMRNIASRQRDRF